MIEKDVENCLVNGIKKLDGLCFKFISPGTLGVPDRIVVTKNGRVFFVELKTKTGRTSKRQDYVIKQLIKRGVDVRVLKGASEVKNFLAEVKNEIHSPSVPTALY